MSTAISHRRLNCFRSEKLLNVSIFGGDQLETDWNISDRFPSLVITITIDSEGFAPVVRAWLSFATGYHLQRLFRCESIRFPWWYAWLCNESASGAVGVALRKWPETRV